MTRNNSLFVGKVVWITGAGGGVGGLSLAKLRRVARAHVSQPGPLRRGLQVGEQPLRSLRLHIVGHFL